MLECPAGHRRVLQANEAVGHGIAQIFAQGRAEGLQCGHHGCTLIAYMSEREGGCTCSHCAHPPPEAPAAPETYTVQANDSFWSIGNARGFTVDQMQAANPGTEPGALQPGQIILLP